MSLDAAILKGPQGAFPNALDADAAASILKHAVKIWARDHGVAEAELPRLTAMVVAFANSAIRDCERKVQAIA